MQRSAVAATFGGLSKNGLGDDDGDLGRGSTLYMSIKNMQSNAMLRVKSADLDIFWSSAMRAAQGSSGSS